MNQALPSLDSWSGGFGPAAITPYRRSSGPGTGTAVGTAVGGGVDGVGGGGPGVGVGVGVGATTVTDSSGVGVAVGSSVAVATEVEFGVVGPGAGTTVFSGVPVILGEGRTTTVGRTVAVDLGVATGPAVGTLLPGKLVAGVSRGGKAGSVAVGAGLVGSTTAGIADAPGVTGRGRATIGVGRGVACVVSVAAVTPLLSIGFGAARQPVRMRIRPIRVNHVAEWNNFCLAGL